MASHSGPVTELALLCLVAPTAIESQSPRSHLKAAREARQTLAGVEGTIVIAVGRHTIKEGVPRGEEVVKEGLGGDKRSGSCSPGWRSKEDHSAFADTEEFREYGRIRELVESVEVLHGVKLDI
jgi:hypothetical protein